MAGIPLNTFRTVTLAVQQANPLSMTVPPGPIYDMTNIYALYQAPPGTTGVVLYCQIANVGNVNYTASMWHYRPAGSTFTPIVYQIPIPTNDARTMLDGKLVLETGDMIFVSGNSPSSPGVSNLKLIASILESANQ